MTTYMKKKGSRNGIFGRHITEDGLRNVELYSYRSTGATFMDSLMNPFWEFFENIIPASISPNILTLSGFLCSLVAQAIISMYCPTLNCRIPTIISIAVGFLLFLYQTLDAIDGKHARKLNLSSPLGQFLDHGLDSFTTIFFTNIFCTACRMGWSYKYFTFLTVVQLKLFSFIWIENHCRVFRCSSSDYLGVTESQIFVILFLIFSSTIGDNILTYPLFLDIKSVDIFIFIVIITGIITLVNDTKASYGECKTSTHKQNARLEICGALCHVLFQILFLFSDVCLVYPILCTYIIITNTSIIALKMNVSSFTREQLPFIHWPLIPFYLSSILLLFGNIIIEYFSEFQHVVLIFISIWNTLYIFDFSIVVVGSICDSLNTSLFGTENRSRRSKHKTGGAKLCDEISFNKTRSYSISRSSKKEY